MRRGYSRESYLDLIQKARSLIPNVSLSSDFISGFCGETEADHKDTISLMEEVKYDMAFMFAYSMREKTPAHRKLTDDVAEDVKKKRLSEVIDTYNETIKKKNQLEIGKTHVVLVEKPSRRDKSELFGRTDTNKKVVFPDVKIPSFAEWKLKGQESKSSTEEDEEGRMEKKAVQVGDYVLIKIESSPSGQTLKGRALSYGSLSDLTKEAALL